jgi:hypothetical protein
MTQEDPLSELKKISWLSEWIRAEITRRYPQLVPKSWHHRMVSRLRTYIHLPMVWAFFAFGLFFLANEAFLAKGIVFTTFNTRDLNDILGSFVDALAAMLGIVIPLVILVIEFLGRDSNDVIDIYLDRTEIKRTALSALIVLAIHILLKLIIGMEIAKIEGFYFYITVLLLMLNLAVLFNVGVALNKARQSLNNDFFIQAFLERVTRDIRENQREEVERRYSRIFQMNVSGILELHRSLSSEIPSHMSQNTILLRALRSGVITDIHIQKWIEFGQSLKVRLRDNVAVKGYIVKFIGDFVSKGDPIAYVASNDEQENTRVLQIKLNHSLRIGKKISSTGTDVSRLLRHLKIKTRLAIKEEDDELFDQFLDVYLNIFGLGLELPAPPSDSLIPQLFSGWNVIATIVFHLEDVIDTAAQSQNDYFIRGLTYRLSSVIEAIIERSDIHISESLQDILRLFSTVYFRSKQYNNETGVNRSFYYLTGDTIDHVWMGKFEHVYKKKEALDNLKRLLFAIFNTLVEIARLMIDYGDSDKLRALLNRLQPDEFLARFYSIAQPIENEKWELEWKLRDATQVELSSFTAQLEVLNSALNIKQDISSGFNQFIFVAASYIAEKYANDEIDLRRTIELWTILRPYFVPFNQLVVLFSKLVQSEGLAWHSFHRHPDTKHAFFPDDEAKFYLVYCLRGLELLAGGKISEDLPSLELQFQLPRLETVCNAITQDFNRWSPVLEPIQDISTLTNQFIDLNKQIAEKWQFEREQQIIKAPLDPVKVSVFEEAFYETRNKTPSLRIFLEQRERVLYGAKFPGKKILGFNQRGHNKECFTSLYLDLNYAKQLGVQYSNLLISTENNLLVSAWLKKARFLPTLKDWQTLEPYVERAFAHMHVRGYQIDLIIVPSGIKYEFFQNTPKFVNVHNTEVPDSLPHLRGLYEKIPVLEWPAHLNENILFVDTKKASWLDIEYVKVELKPLPDDEIKRILEKDPNCSEKQLHLSIWVKISEKARVRLLDAKAVARLPIKLPDTLWIRRRNQLEELPLN